MAVQSIREITYRRLKELTKIKYDSEDVDLLKEIKSKASKEMMHHNNCFAVNIAKKFYETVNMFTNDILRVTDMGKEDELVIIVKDFNYLVDLIYTRETQNAEKYIISSDNVREVKEKLLDRFYRVSEEENNAIACAAYTYMDEMLGMLGLNSWENPDEYEVSEKSILSINDPLYRLSIVTGSSKTASQLLSMLFSRAVIDRYFDIDSMDRAANIYLVMKAECIRRVQMNKISPVKCNIPAEAVDIMKAMAAWSVVDAHHGAYDEETGSKVYNLMIKSIDVCDKYESSKEDR